MAELEKKGWPNIEGWIAEEEMISSDKELPIKLGMGTMGAPV